MPALQACWAHSRTAPPQRDDLVAARAAAAATEDLLGSLAVTDMAELAWRQSAYVAHRRAEGYSEGHARVCSPAPEIHCLRLLIQVLMLMPTSVWAGKERS